MVIRMPPAWGWEQLGDTVRSMKALSPESDWAADQPDEPIVLRRLSYRDLGYALARGFDDLGAYRIDVLFLCVVYPILGLLLARLAFGQQMLPLIFPLASGFALIGPFAAVGLNEMSRRRELGEEPRWTSAFKVFRSPALGKILVLGLALMIIFLFWLLIAQLIYDRTLGRLHEGAYGVSGAVPLTRFVADVVTTPAGWTMAVAGIGVGFLFAVAVFAISVVSFPLLLDRDVSVEAAVRTSVQAVMSNPRIMTVWGLIIAAALVIGSLPALLGLVVVMPLLGHATWHLYRRVVQA